jgi:hypothetical protein
MLAEVEGVPYPSLEVLPEWWQDRAACVEADPETFFPNGDNGSAKNFVLIREAKAICATCPALPRCRDYADALEQRVGRSHLFGVIGGETPAERWRRRRALG